MLLLCQASSNAFSTKKITIVDRSKCKNEKAFITKAYHKINNTCIFVFFFGLVGRKRNINEVNGVERLQQKKYSHERENNGISRV